MALVDWVLVLAAVVAVVMGLNQRLTTSAGTLLGMVLGLILGRLLAPAATKAVLSWGILDPSDQTVFATAVPLVAGVIGGAVGCALGAALRDAITSRVGVRLDAAGGGLLSLVAFVLIVWLAAGWIRTTPFIAGNRLVAESAVVAALDRVAPVESTQALGSLASVLGPSVFSGQPERIRDVGAPQATMNEVGRNAAGSVVKITTDRTVYNTVQEGTGWVFESGYVVTNAHVVAGSSGLNVQVAGKGRPYSANVVAFNSSKDIAVLRVADLQAKPLELGGELRDGADSVVVGFPENGPYTISPARVRESLRARGLDIYEKKSVDRDIYSLRAVVRSGNSGGPLIDTNGRAVGLVFAKSAVDPDTGYALTLDEIRGTLSSGENAKSTVSTGSCTAEG